MPSPVDWATADVDSVVDSVMRGASPLDMHRDDRLPIDALAREWRQQDDAIQQTIGTSVARYLRMGNAQQRGWVLKFYELCPKASGGDAMAQLARDGAEGFDENTLNRVPGLIGDTLREALLYSAVAWRGGEAVDDALIALVTADILTGDGGALLYAGLRYAPDWFEANEETVLALYPNAPTAVFRARMKRGMAPEDALDSVLARASDRGRRRLQAAIRFDRKGLSAEQRKNLLARL